LIGPFSRRYQTWVRSGRASNKEGPMGFLW